MSFFRGQLLGNDIRQWISALAVIFVLTGCVLLLRKIIARRAGPRDQRPGTGLGALFAEIAGQTKSYTLFLAALYPVSFLLELPARAGTLIASVAFIALALQIGLWASCFISSGFRMYAGRKTGQTVGDSGVTVMTLIGRTILWGFVLLVILENIGVNVTTLIASLGVAGIVIGLATQNILGDLFAALSILLDRPFEVGHFIIVDDYPGTVEKIGLKTTRVRSLGGELLIFGNNDLLKSRIRNYTRFRERRVAFTFGVRYFTPAEKLKKIPQIVRRIIEETENTRFDRAHFKTFGDFSLVFEVVYYVLNPDYNLYMDIQEKINLAVFEAFEKEGIGFAFPTRTIHIASQPEQNSPGHDRPGLPEAG